MAHDSINKKNVAAWTPDLFGPIFKKQSLTLKQILNLRDVDEQIHHMATFVPDEVLYLTDLSEKSLRGFRAVLMFLNISGFSMLFKRYIHDQNGGSLALTRTLNDYIYIAVREIYCSEGDILKFSAEGLLAAWKVQDDEFMFNTVQNVIVRAINIQNSISALKDVNVNVTISAGDVMFSVIGSDKARHFVIFGLPIEELKNAKKISLPNDLVLSLSAWQHCTPNQYEYVIKDPYNIKIIRILEQSDTKSTDMTSSDHDNYEKSADGKFVTNADRPLSPYRKHFISINGESETEIANKKEKVLTAISTIAAINPNFGAQLRSYLPKQVVQQIEKSESLGFLSEVRRITLVAINIIPDKYSDNELILLVDKCFLLLHSIVTQYGGCINTANLYEKNIFFCIAFGIRGCSSEDQFKIDETCKNGIVCATHILQTVKTVAKVQSVFVGVSTGMAYCGVIGHIARRYYAIIGPPVDKATRIMDISYDKVSCDYDTVLHSHFRKDQFHSRGVRTLHQLEKYHIYEYLDDPP